MNKTRLNINEAFKLATNFHIKNQINKAKNLYIQILKIKPDYIDVMNNLGELYRHQGQFDKAIDLFKKVLNINSNNAIDIQSPIIIAIEVELVGAKFKGQASIGFLYNIPNVAFL